MKFTLTVVISSLALSLSACKKETAPEKEAPETAATPAAQIPKPAVPDSPAAAAEALPLTEVTDGIPTEEDYEEEAAQTISASNLETELDKLEAEIGGS
jgi:hypothetical protein